jgi:hypothetical protein
VGGTHKNGLAVAVNAKHGEVLKKLQRQSVYHLFLAQ